MPTERYYSSSSSDVCPSSAEQLNIYQISNPPSNSYDSSSHTGYESSPGSSSSYFNPSTTDTNRRRSSGSLASPDTTSQENFTDNFQAFLKIIEQPIEKYPFRYLTESRALYGSIVGERSSRKQKSWPTVKLCNYRRNVGENVIIRCTLTTTNAVVNAGEPLPHVHRLVHKDKKEDDPVDVPVDAPSFTASFKNMTIIKVDNPNQSEVYTKKKIRHFCKTWTAPPTKEVLDDIKPQLEQAATDELSKITSVSRKEPVLNKACLKFEALIDRATGQYERLPCCPIYSRVILDSKCIKFNELTITGLDKWSGSVLGGEDLIILVNKVEKESIKVVFCETSKGSQTAPWRVHADIQFVHHSVAIMIRTPAYKQREIEDEVTVYFYLERKSDGAVSEPREWRYEPQQGLRRKRARINTPSSPLPSSSSLPQSIEITSTSKLATQCTASAAATYAPCSTIHPEPAGDLSTVSAMDLIDDSLNLFYLDMDQIMIQDNFLTNMNTFDGVEQSECLQEQRIGSSDDPIIKPRQESEWNIARSLPQTPENGSGIFPKASEVVKLFKPSGTWKENCINYMEKTFEKLQKRNAEGNLHMNDVKITLQKLFSHPIWEKENRLFHILVEEESQKTDMFVNFVKTYNFSAILDQRNKSGETALHVAVRNGKLWMVKLLLDGGVSVDERNNEGLTALQLAISSSSPATIVAALMEKQPNLSVFNKEGMTVLHVAVMNQRLDLISLLTDSEVDENTTDFLNLRDKKQGNTALHMAVSQRYTNIVKFLLKFNNQLDVDINNFRGLTVLDLVWDSPNPVDKELKCLILSVCEDMVEVNEPE